MQFELILAFVGLLLSLLIERNNRKSEKRSIRVELISYYKEMNDHFLKTYDLWRWWLLLFEKDKEDKETRINIESSLMASIADLNTSGYILSTLFSNYYKFSKDDSDKVNDLRMLTEEIKFFIRTNIWAGEPEDSIEETLKQKFDALNQLLIYDLDKIIFDKKLKGEYPLIG